jgi:hypothetical protein
MFLLRVEKISPTNNNLLYCYYTVSSGSVQSAKGGSPEFSTLYEFDVENSMFRPIDGFVQSSYNIIDIIIIQIILSERCTVWTSSAEHPNWQR